VGNTAAAPYTMMNDVKLVDLLGIVRRLQSTEGTSATNFLALVLNQAWTSSPSRVRMQGFRPCIIKSLARSTYLFICGWATTTQSARMLMSSQKSKNF
jgi:hypothetical protein